MECRALLLLKAPSLPTKHHVFFNQRKLSSFMEQRSLRNEYRISVNRSAKETNESHSLPAPDATHLAETARISLTPQEVEEFAPKIGQVIDWFGQLQAVDLSSVEPAIRADTDGNILRDDSPETFGMRQAMIEAVPSYEEPYIKVPKVLNKE